MITSRQNALVKKLRSLADKKKRDLSGEYTAEGFKAVRDALSVIPEKVKLVVYSEKAAKEIESDPLFSGVEKVAVTDGVFDSVSAETTPQGVIAVMEKPENESVRPFGKCVYLDGVADPFNAGAIVRTACAAGYDAVFGSNGSADLFSPKAVRASMGGIYRIKTARIEEDTLIKSGIPLIVADMDGESVFSFVPPKSFCLVVGNEGNGVSEKIRLAAKSVVSLPMENGMESLNAAVSAGILAYLLKTNQKGE